MGHQGTERTLLLIKDCYYWPGIHRHVEAWIKKCERCTLSKGPLPRVRQAIGHLLATRPLEVLANDFTLLEPDTDGGENVLVMTDVFTTFTQAAPTRDQHASTTPKALLRECFFKYGHSDQGTSFENAVITKLCKMYDTKKSHITSLIPKAMPNAKDLTEPCPTCPVHCHQKRKESGQGISQNFFMPVTWCLVSPPATLHII